MHKHIIAERAAVILEWCRDRPKAGKSGLCSLIGDYMCEFGTSDAESRLNSQAYHLIKDGMVAWPEGTGFGAYPVPGQVAPGALMSEHRVLLAASRAFEASRDAGTMWHRNRRYGAARWRMLDWLQGVWLGEVTGRYPQAVTDYCNARTVNHRLEWFHAKSKRERMDNIDLPAELTKRKTYVLLSGVKIKWLSAWGEWKVTTPGGSTYHTDCIKDAYYTAIALGVQSMDSVTA